MIGSFLDVETEGGAGDGHRNAGTAVSVSVRRRHNFRVGRVSMKNDASVKVKVVPVQGKSSSVPATTPAALVTHSTKFDSKSK